MTWARATLAITPPLLVLWGTVVVEYGFMEGTKAFAVALVSTAVTAGQGQEQDNGKVQGGHY